MTRIWKFSLQFTDRQAIRMPVGAKILTVQMQNGNPQIWAQCDVDEEGTSSNFETRTFCIYGTGNWMPDNPGEYIATVQASGGRLVWHIFEC